MFRRTRFIAVATVLGAGLVALVLIPGDGASVGKADANDAKVALASVSSPNPDLLARLDAEVAPYVKPTVEAEAKPVATASVQPVALQPATDVATPAIPDATDPDLRPATIGASAVNMRAGPSSSAQQLAVLQPGEAVQTGQNITGWVKVTRADGSSGWMYSSYLSGNAQAQAASDPAPKKVASTQQPRATVKGGDGDLRDRMARIGSELPAYDRPGSAARAIFTFSPGERVRIAEVRGNWLRVETNDGTSAWIRR
jgi:SH3-like domain-containing protein